MDILQYGQINKAIQRHYRRHWKGGFMSKKYTLNKADFKSLGIGFIIVLAGSALTFVADNVGLVDFGQATPFVVAFAALLVNVGRKYLQSK